MTRDSWSDDLAIFAKTQPLLYSNALARSELLALEAGFEPGAKIDNPMISKGEFQKLVEQGLIAHVRVVPVPFEQAWCIDVVVRTPLEPGSTTDTIAKRERRNPPDTLRSFESIDEATRFLRNVGITSFTVDTADAVSSANVGTHAVRVLETTMRLWSDEAAAPTNDSRATA